MNTQFFIHMIPPTVTAQEHRVGISKSGKPYFYDSAEIKAAKVKFRDHLAAYVPKQQYTGPAFNGQMAFPDHRQSPGRRVQDLQAGHG